MNIEDRIIHYELLLERLIKDGTRYRFAIDDMHRHIHRMIGLENTIAILREKENSIEKQNPDTQQAQQE